MSLMSMTGLQKWFGKTPVLRGVDIEVADGEFVVLVGPSGCGKSTLLRMIAGLEDVDEGEIRLGQRVLNEVSAKDRDIAMVFQNYALYPHMTVAENMGFSMRLSGAAKSDILQSVKSAAAILGLEDLLDRYPRQLSGGQRQRVAMGRAIVRDPQVFLFDEPLSNLDAKMRVQMRAEIKALHQRLGTTTIYVTHDQVEALTMADKVVVMNEGRVEQTGAPLAIYDHPVNLFVAQFIGSPAMNILEGRARTIGGQPGLAMQQDQWMPLSRLPQCDEGQALAVGIRPEHLQFDDSGLEVEVRLVEPTGSETQVIMRLPQGQLTLLSRERLKLMPGDRVRVMPDPGQMHFFDPQSGQRLQPVAQAVKD